MNGRRTGRKASQIIIDGTHCDEFMVGTNAFSAQDAFAQIPDNKRIRLLQRFVIGHRIKFSYAHAHLSSNPTQLAAVALAADNAGFRMLGDHQAHNVAAMAQDPRGLGSNGHLLGHRRDTGGHQPTGFFIFHQAHPAGAEGFQVRMVAQVGDFNVISRRGFQYRSPGCTGDLFVINA